MAVKIQGKPRPASEVTEVADNIQEIFQLERMQEANANTRDASVAIREMAPAILKVFESDALHYQAKRDFNGIGRFSDVTVDNLGIDLRNGRSGLEDNYDILNENISRLTKPESESLFGVCVRGREEIKSLKPEIDKVVVEMKKIADKHRIKYDEKALEDYVVLILRDSLNKNLCRNTRQDLKGDFSMLNAKTFYETVNELADNDRSNDINALKQLKGMLLPESTYMHTEHNGKRYFEIGQEIDKAIVQAKEASYIEGQMPFVTSKATADFAKQAKESILQDRDLIEIHPREGVTDYLSRGTYVIKDTAETKIVLDNKSGMKLAEELLDLAKTFRQKGDEGHMSPINVKKQEVAINALAQYGKN